MKNSIRRIGYVACILLVSSLFMACNEVQSEQEAEDRYPEKKLSPEEATEVSKLFVKDMRYYFRVAEAYEQLQSDLDSIEAASGSTTAKRANLSSEDYVKLIKKADAIANSKDSKGDFNADEELSKQKFVLSVSNWYSLDELENFIAFSKHNARKNGYEMDGVRIYIGVLPNDEKYKEKKGYLTTFISPTGNKNTQEGGFMVFGDASKDLPGGSSAEYGNSGDPPSATYPQ